MCAESGCISMYGCEGVEKGREALLSECIFAKNNDVIDAVRQAELTPDLTLHSFSISPPLQVCDECAIILLLPNELEPRQTAFNGSLVIANEKEQAGKSQQTDVRCFYKHGSKQRVPPIFLLSFFFCGAEPKASQDSQQTSSIFVFIPWGSARSCVWGIVTTNSRCVVSSSGQTV